MVNKISPFIIILLFFGCKEQEEPSVLLNYKDKYISVSLVNYRIDSIFIGCLYSIKIKKNRLGNSKVSLIKKNKDYIYKDFSKEKNRCFYDSTGGITLIIYISNNEKKENGVTVFYGDYKLRSNDSIVFKSRKERGLFY